MTAIFKRIILYAVEEIKRSKDKVTGEEKKSLKNLYQKQVMHHLKLQRYSSKDVTIKI